MAPGGPKLPEGAKEAELLGRGVTTGEVPKVGGGPNPDPPLDVGAVAAVPNIAGGAAVPNGAAGPNPPKVGAVEDEAPKIL